MPLIDIVIPGYAAPLAAPGPIAETFKRAVADAARCVWQGPFVKKPCAVRLTYDLDDGRYATTALFNLLKSVIDGLGHVAFAPAHGGSGKWHREDHWITELHALKRRATGGPQVRIEFGPVTGAVTAGESTAAVATAYVPGNAPPWPGDAVGAAKVVEFEKHLSKVLACHKRPNPADSLVIDLRFVLDPAKMWTSDLDNLCVPAAQSICRVLFGDKTYGKNFVELCASKFMASGEEVPGTFIQVWRG